MDIILPTRFNNPNLPIVQRPGFTDNFNRPESDDLGTTSGESRPWEVHNWPSTTSVWGINVNGTASAKTVGGPTAALVDALVPDGELVATLASVPTEGRYGGLIVRWQDVENYIVVAERASSDQRLAILMRKDGTNSQLQSNPSADAPVDGDTIRAVLSGTNMRVFLNDTEILGGDFPDFAGSTRFGLYASSSGGGFGGTQWDSIEFTPA